MNVMEVKKTQTSQAKTDRTTAFEFVGDVKQEIQRINWTSKEELKVYTKIIVLATFSLGIGIFLVDVCIRNALSFLSNTIHWIAG